MHCQINVRVRILCSPFSFSCKSTMPSPYSNILNTVKIFCEPLRWWWMHGRYDIHWELLLYIFISLLLLSCGIFNPSYLLGIKYPQSKFVKGQPFQDFSGFRLCVASFWTPPTVRAFIMPSRLLRQWAPPFIYRTAPNAFWASLSADFLQWSTILRISSRLLPAMDDFTPNFFRTLWMSELLRQ